MGAAGGFKSQIPVGRLRAQLRTAFGAAVIQDLATCFCRHTGAETVAVLANPVRRLERALHSVSPVRGPNPKGFEADLHFRSVV